MNLGYIKIATFTPEIKVADVNFNVSKIKEGVDKAIENGVKVLAFPELTLSGYTVGDLFRSKTILDACLMGLNKIVKYTENKDIVVFLGLPIKINSNIYNACACVANGKILGVVPKNYHADIFSSGETDVTSVDINGDSVPFGSNIIFSDKIIKNLKIGVEIGEDLFAPVSPSIYHAVNGARVIVNLSASVEFSGEKENRRNAIKELSKKAVCAYLYANAGYGESTTDCVYSGHSLVVEDGEILAENQPFVLGLNTAIIDLDYIDFKRSKTFNQDFCNIKRIYQLVEFELKNANAYSQRVYDKTPFIKNGEEELLLNIQAQGLAKRIKHTKAPKIVIGLSGGLDSTLALLVCQRAVKLLGRDTKDVTAITMPCFGTTSRTLENSISLAKALNVTLKKIDISKSVSRHLKDLKHDGKPDVTFENAQARERTQVLMDIANMNCGLVVGTGDLSELALGWATYNGDHMSMYSVNCSIPKTLVRHLVNYYANKSRGKLKTVLLDILDTPVSPELLPQTDDKIKQVTEDIVGPYILHDFFLYHFIKRGATPIKIYYSALNTFDGIFDKETIVKWLKTFIRRFFNQQFKRSCVPDGVKVSEISLSPRGEWKMPSDAVSKIWLDQLESIDLEKY